MSRTSTCQGMMSAPLFSTKSCEHDHSSIVYQHKHSASRTAVCKQDPAHLTITTDCLRHGSSCTLKSMMEVASVRLLTTGPRTKVGFIVTKSSPSRLEMAQASFSASVCSMQSKHQQTAPTSIITIQPS